MNPDFDGKRIFITGGTGFVGSLVLRRLKEASKLSKSGISATVLSRNPDAFQKSRPELVWPGLHFLKGDIGNFRLDPADRFDAVLHAGNPASVASSKSDIREFFRTTVAGTENLLKEIGRLEKPPARLLLTSSGAVYQTRVPSEEPIPESAPTGKLGVYSEAKLAAEVAVKKFAGERQIGLTIGRIFACGGPYLPLAGRFALGQFIRSARDSGEIVVRSEGLALRSYLAGDEVAGWLLTLLGQPGQSTEAFNVGSDDAIRIREVAETVQGVFAKRGKKIALRFEPPADAPPPDHYLPDVRLIAEKLGLKPIKSSTQSIEETTEWALNEAGSIA